MKIDKEQLLDSLYTRCKNGSVFSYQTSKDILNDIGIFNFSHDKILSVRNIILNYKTSSKNLELTLNNLYNYLTAQFEENLTIE